MYDTADKRKRILREHANLLREAEDELRRDPMKEWLKDDPAARQEYEEFLREEFEDPEHSDVLMEKQSRPEEKGRKKRPRI